MEKILDQEEIDRLFLATQQRAQEKLAPEQERRHISSCNFRQASRISSENIRDVSMLHDMFARTLTHSLGAYLRAVFEANLVSVEQLSYGEFLQRIPEITYLASVNVQPLEAVAALELDLGLAFPIIDLLLGGQGKTESQVRQITEIEEQILESVVRIICREFQSAWQPMLEIEFLFDQRQQQTQILRLMSPNEKILALSFECRLANVRGLLNVAFPAVVSNALLRRLSQQWSNRKRGALVDSSTHLWQRLQDCRFPIQLSLPGTPICVRDLLELQPGQVLALPHRIGDSVFLSVSGKKMFAAQLVRSGNLRGGEVLQRLQISEAPRNDSQ